MVDQMTEPKKRKIRPKTKERVCFTVDSNVMAQMRSRGINLSKITETMFRAFLDPSVEFRRIDQ